MAQHDHNHPPDLAIKPSSARAGSSRGQEGGGQEWQTDSVDTIKEFGIAGRVWEAAYLFVKYLRPPRWTNDRLGDDDDVTFDFDPPCPLFTHPSSPEPLTVLELGSGVGVVGLTCARELYAQRRRRRQEDARNDDDLIADTVILTDLENVVDLMTRNARLAGVPGVQVRALPWGSRRHAREILNEIAAGQQGKRLDYILCSDLVYFTELLAPLLSSLLDLTEGGPDVEGQGSSQTIPPPVLIAYKIRSMTKELPLWTALGRWFDVDVVHCRRRRRARTKKAGEETSEEKEEKEETRPSEEWHRFGSLQGDLAREGEAPDEDDADDEMSDDAYFVLIARRKASTQGWSAPEEDEALMAGWMCQGDERRRGTGGADWLEWCLMSAMG